MNQRFEVDTIDSTMKIPNEEIRYIYRTTIREWFHEKIQTSNYPIFYQDFCPEIVQKFKNLLILNYQTVFAVTITLKTFIMAVFSEFSAKFQVTK